jgi:hypothetical protein
MNTIEIQISDSMLNAAKHLADKDGVSLDQFIARAVAEKISALTTLDFVAKRLARDPREVLLEILAKVPKAAPKDYDRA